MNSLASLFAILLSLGASLHQNKTGEVSFQNYTETPLDNRSIASYPFDGSPNDESGNGHHGALQGEGVSPAVDRYNRSHHAYRFDGKSGYISIGNFMQGAVDFSYTFWVKTSQVESGSFRFNDPAIIGTQQKGYLSQGFALTSYNGYLAWADGLYNHETATYTTAYTTPFYLADGSWHYLAVSRSGKNVTFYASEGKSCDAIQIVGNTPTGLAPMGNHVQEIGRSYYVYYDYGSHSEYKKYFKGLMDSLNIYRRALSEEEITALCSFGSPTITPTTYPSSSPTTAHTTYPTLFPITASTASPLERQASAPNLTVLLSLYTKETASTEMRSSTHKGVRDTNKKEEPSLLVTCFIIGTACASLIAIGTCAYCRIIYKRLKEETSGAPMAEYFVPNK